MQLNVQRGDAKQGGATFTDIREAQYVVRIQPYLAGHAGQIGENQMQGVGCRQAVAAYDGVPVFFLQDSG